MLQIDETKLKQNLNDFSEVLFPNTQILAKDYWQKMNREAFVEQVYNLVKKSNNQNKLLDI